MALQAVLPDRLGNQQHQQASGQVPVLNNRPENVFRESRFEVTRSKGILEFDDAW